MLQDRKKYRKSFNSSGQLYIAGEVLEFISHDVSVTGLMVSISPGALLSKLSDFEALLQENSSAEIYVKELKLTGEVDISWVKSKDDKIMLGLEFKEAMYSANKLWRKRRYYRSKEKLFGYLMIGDKQIDFHTIDVSTDGIQLQLNEVNESLKSGGVVNFLINGLNIKGKATNVQGVKAIGKIIWIKTIDQQACFLGLRYIVRE